MFSALLVAVYVDAITEAASVILTPEGLFFLVVGTCLGLVFGVLPGLGGAVALALLVPITFTWDPMPAIILMTSAIGGVAFGGSISAILLNVPGTAPNAATMLDGFPLSQRGEGETAIGASATASALGAIIGVIVLIISIPIIRMVLRMFGAPEFFIISLLGVILVAFAIRTSLLNGIIAGGVGMSLTFVGYNPVTGGTRYTFGNSYLYDGIPLVIIIIGVFAISEMLNLLIKNKTIARKGLAAGGSAINGLRAVFENYVSLLRGAFVGVVVGMIPGAGGSVANFMAYAVESRYPGGDWDFGEGNIRGVIGPEAANDAKEGGALIPTIAFGIPGSGAWAVMLGVFITHGIQPGPLFLDNHLDVVFVIIFALIGSNILTSVLGVILSEYLVRITVTPPTLLGPVVLVLALIGTYAYRTNVTDVWVVILIGILGLVMMQYGFSRVALIIGVVLGPIAENNLNISLQISQGSYWIFVNRPVSAFLLLVAIGILLQPLLKYAYWRHRNAG